MKLEEGSKKILFSQLPGVSLIKGNPSSKYKNELLQRLMKIYSIPVEDILIINNLNSEAVRSVKSFCAVWPFNGLKVVIIDMNGASERSQNSLLKLLEEPPNSIYFILYSSDELLSTVESRSLIFKDSNDEKYSQDDKKAVVEALKAVMNKDLLKLESIIKSWTDETQKALVQWALETKSGKFDTFSFEETLGLGLPDSFPVKLITALCALDRARPKLAARSVLYSAIGVQ